MEINTATHPVRSNPSIMASDTAMTAATAWILALCSCEKRIFSPFAAYLKLRSLPRPYEYRQRQDNANGNISRRILFHFPAKVWHESEEKLCGIEIPGLPGGLCPPSELGQCDCCGDGGVERLRAGVICRIRGDEKTA